MGAATTIGIGTVEASALLDGRHYLGALEFNARYYLASPCRDALAVFATPTASRRLAVDPRGDADGVEAVAPVPVQHGKDGAFGATVTTTQCRLPHFASSLVTDVGKTLFDNP
jgi:hypothetical protein